MSRNTIGFSTKTFKSTGGFHIDKQIMTAVEKRGYFRKEVSRIFQMANRRIQNVEKSGLVSPAVVALNKGDIKGFTKFSMKGDLNTLKVEYAKAIAFLQQPTSTATGTREYSKHLQQSYNLTDKEFKLMQDKLMGKIASVSDERFLEQYLMQYKDFTGELETECSDVSDMLENDATRVENALDNAFESLSKSPTSEAYINDVDSFNDDKQLKDILDRFADFGL